MPKIRLVAYREDDGTVPLRDWLDGLQGKARDKCLVRLQRLEALGHELRRPEADFLRDDIHELRVNHRRLNYRMLYFFRGRKATIVSHGCTKERTVPKREIEAAIARKRRFARNPKKHSERFAKD